MSEIAIIKRIIPQIKISSMDNHRVLTPLAAQGKTRPGSQAPRRDGQPTRPEWSDVALKQAPIEVTMHGGGGITVSRPPGAKSNAESSAEAGKK